MIRELLKKYQEIISYFIFGALTTIVNLVAYRVFKLIKFNLYLSVILAWTISVTFSFVTNKMFVFESKQWKLDVMGKELFLFLSARIFSLGIDLIDMGIMVNVLMIPDMTAKFISNVIGAIINYVFSKFVIFKK